VSAPEAIVSGLRLPPRTAVGVLQRARADQVYATALMTGEAGLARELAPTEVLTVARALRTVEAHLDCVPEVFAGSGVAEFADQITSVFPEAEPAPAEDAIPTAGEVARIAAHDPDRGTEANALSLTPRYVQLSQAEREFGVDLGLSGGERRA
jgi:tRNA A37 threonylcarbamoyladenosine modification protein TsaB